MTIYPVNSISRNGRSKDVKCVFDSPGEVLKVYLSFAWYFNGIRDCHGWRNINNVTTHAN